MPKSDRELAIAYWGPNEGPSRFSKLLRGDYGCAPETAQWLAGLMAKRVEAWRAARGRAGPGVAPLIAAEDLDLPLNLFIQRLVAAGGEVEEETLARVHRDLVAELSPEPSTADPGGPSLKVLRYSTDRAFAGFVGAGAADPTVFVPERHLGQLVIDPAPLGRDLWVYAFITRDAAPAGPRIWQVPFRDTVLWLPSPFQPRRDGEGRALLLPEPAPVLPLPGSYHATAVLVDDPTLLAKLDPRGGTGIPTAKGFDESETVRFLTLLHRATSRSPGHVTIATARYVVQATEEGRGE